MASAYSAPLNYQDTLQISDVAQYSGAVQSQMQQKYDVNLNKIRDIVGQISSAPLVREKDKEYLGNRLQQMLAQVDAGSKINLTDNTATSQINNYIYGAIDDYTKQQIKNSQKIIQFNTEMVNKKTKEPKLYNDKNLAYAYHKAGYDSYKEGKTDDLGELNYHNFVDKTSVLDALKKIKELKGDQTVEVKRRDINGNLTGEIEIKKIDGLSEKEISEYMPQLLSTDILGQLQIDGWAKYKDHMPEAKQQFNKIFDGRVTAVTDNITKYTAMSKNPSLSKAVRDRAAVELKDAIVDKQDLEAAKANINPDNPEDVGYFLEKEGYRYSLSKIASGRESTTYKSDGYFFDRKNLELAIDRNDRDLQKDALDIELKKAELKLKGLEAQEKQGELNTSTGQANGSAYLQSPSEDKNKPEEIDPLKIAQDEHTKHYKDAVDAIFRGYHGDKTSKEERDHFDAELLSKGLMLTADGKIGTVRGKENIAKNYSRLSVATEAFSKSKISTHYEDLAKNIYTSEINASRASKGVSDAYNDAFTNKYKSNPRQYLNQLEAAYAYTQSSNKDDVVPNTIYNTFANLAFTPSNNVITVGRKAGEDIGKLKDVGLRIQAFVNSNGGGKKLQQTLETNPNKLREMAELIAEVKQLSPVARLSISGDDLLGDSRKEASRLLVERNKTSGIIPMLTPNQFNVVNNKEKTKLFDMMIQDGNSVMSANFSKDMAVTIVPLGNDEYEIRQKQGLTTYKGSPAQKPDAIYKVEKGTAIQKYLNSVVTSIPETGLDASASKDMVISPYTEPEFIDSGKKSQLSTADRVVGSIRPDILKAFSVNPLNLLNEARTKEVFKTALNGRVSKEDMEYLLPRISNNLKYYNLSIKPIDGRWGAEVKSNINSTLTLGEGSFTGTTNYLDKDILTLAKDYPQTFILNSMLQYLYENPDQVKTVIKP